MKTKTTKTLTDAKGTQYDVKQLRPEIVKRDILVRKIVQRAEKLNQHIIKEKARMEKELSDYLTTTAEKHGENWKGNAKLYSYDNQLMVTVQCSEIIEFDETINIVKQKVDRCLKTWSAGANDNLKAVVTDAFQVDKMGKYNIKRLLMLKRYNINDTDWHDAMDLLQEAMQVITTKQYLNIYKRPSPDDKFQQITLNFSNL